MDGGRGVLAEFRNMFSSFTPLCLRNALASLMMRLCSPPLLRRFLLGPSITVSLRGRSDIFGLYSCNLNTGYNKQTTQPEDFAADAGQDERTPIPPQSNEKKTAPSKEESRGFAAKYASYLQFQKENPGYDQLADDIRRGQAFEAGLARRRESRELFFFYGTLMDPDIVQEVMGLPEPPVLKPALLRNRGHLRMWGPYPAFLADQEPRVDVKGMACEIEGTERKDRLATYEGDNYDETKCFINLVTEDGETDFIVARVFVWIGHEDELSDGSFNLETYKQVKAKLYHGQTKIIGHLVIGEEQMSIQVLVVKGIGPDRVR
ncbi:hypothetical protein J7T55_015421 [Diaporthe amygdali]|uniref:uncharacterized protein n=1 Tax=Phomopsis amygdali TaxID=1214568 RepID=UPI0022FF2627|nr:uncharacterized protein J7T55_015421 [Diaporthe amygdali]KAJ0120689.1 hypothetical protein J7T55_015421 [Diaporthe amygdali]